MAVGTPTSGPSPVVIPATALASSAVTVTKAPSASDRRSIRAR